MDYTLALISYFDILGFKYLINERNDNAEKIYGILENMRREANPDVLKDGLTQTEYTAFSDTIVRSTNILNEQNSNLPLGLLFDELHDVAYAQTQMIFSNVIIRGAITAGDLYHKDDIIFGPGLIKAYNMESNISRYPRIIIDPDVLMAHIKTPFLKSHSHSHAQDREYILGLISQDFDGLWYIDYLKYYFNEVEYPIELLVHHKKLIENNISKYDELCSEYVKYAWMVNYHNNFVTTIDDQCFLGYDIQKEECFIDQGKLPFVYDIGI